jgi:hypothetical protein
VIDLSLLVIYKIIKTARRSETVTGMRYRDTTPYYQNPSWQSQLLVQIISGSCLLGCTVKVSFQSAVCCSRNS